MEFCPTCGNLLQYEPAHGDRRARLFCPTCPYICAIGDQIKIKKRQHLSKKEIEPIFSGEDAMKFAPKTDAYWFNIILFQVVPSDMILSTTIYLPKLPLWKGLLQGATDTVSG
ncbi:PREDICTED: uncharacterized protein LOC104604716 isoform X2 [Nelumbo nucifera]|uniref:Uncharacterized protein LOC104604716 isoform X2 n=1 Tax=Nelumbo nucifera TaxID=4432 RepID=A0A1U8AN23_NELNU|nr:PREDICTED: uncharacterized protein LOC104604716 isoform X2 [Nelumbo nucifera]